MSVSRRTRRPLVLVSAQRPGQDFRPRGHNQVYLFGAGKPAPRRPAPVSWTAVCGMASIAGFWTSVLIGLSAKATSAVSTNAVIMALLCGLGFIATLGALRWGTRRPASWSEVAQHLGRNPTDVAQSDLKVIRRYVRRHGRMSRGLLTKLSRRPTPRRSYRACKVSGIGPAPMPWPLAYFLGQVVLVLSRPSVTLVTFVVLAAGNRGPSLAPATVAVLVAVAGVMVLVAVAEAVDNTYSPVAGKALDRLGSAVRYLGDDECVRQFTNLVETSASLKRYQADSFGVHVVRCAIAQ